MTHKNSMHYVQTLEKVGRQRVQDDVPQISAYQDGTVYEYNLVMLKYGCHSSCDEDQLACQV